MRKYIFFLMLLAVFGVYSLSTINFRFMDLLTSFSSSTLSGDTLSMYEFYIRKTLHLISYFSITILIFLFFYTFHGFLAKLGFFLAPALALGLAAFDEYTQAQTPGRIGILADVFIDGMGILLAMVVIFLVFMIQQIQKEKAQKDHDHPPEL